jgi:hypothetical protein
MTAGASFFWRKLLLFVLVLAAAMGMKHLLNPPAVAYHMPVDGQLTLGLYDEKGALLRWLVKDEHRSAGDHRESWNGLDQWGRKMSPGTYQVRGLCHAPLVADYLLTVDNPGQPPWPTPDGRGDWLSDEGNPQAAVTDGKWVFLAAPNSEKGYSTLAVDETGKRCWGTNEPRHMYARTVSLALADDFLYVLYSGPDRPNADYSPYEDKDAVGRAVLMCFDKATGEPARFARSGPLRVATWPYSEPPVWLWNLRNDHGFAPAIYEGQPRYACLDVAETTNAVGMAAVGDHLYVSLLQENKLLEIDAMTGKPTGRTIPLKAPVGLCRFDDHTLLAVSNGAVVRVRLDDGAVTPLITAGLSAPDNITLDKQGTIYVSDWGTSFQVKAFDVEGKFLRAIGKEGGRPWVGAWDPNGMLVPRGMAVTDKGELYVTEDDGTPPRISVWNAASGTFVRDYLGPGLYGGGTFFWIDPHDASQVHAQGVCYNVDYGKKTWTPKTIDYRRREINDAFTPNGHDLGPHPQVRILYHDGKEYALMNTGPGQLSIMQRQGDIYRPVAALGQVHDEDYGAVKEDGTGQTVWDSDVGGRLYKGYFPDFFRGHMGNTYSWSDANGDNLVQPEEMQWTAKTYEPFAARAGKFGPWTSYWGEDISPDWSLFFVCRFGDGQEIFRLDPKSWTPAGAPIYDLAQVRPIITEPSGHGINSIHVTNDGKLIVSYDYEFGGSPDAIVAYDLEGHRLWSAAMPKQLAGKALHANGAIYDFMVPGVGDVVCAWLYHGSFRPLFFTSDGLYVGTLLEETGMAKFLHWVGFPIRYYVGTWMDDAPTGPAAIWSESAKYFYQGPDGAMYLINGANQQEHMFRIRGLEAPTTQRFETEYRLER